jgi:hypothetical protein
VHSEARSATSGPRRVGRNGMVCPVRARVVIGRRSEARAS